MRITILSKDYEPLTYCNIERAITLLYLNKAEAIKNTDKIIHSISLSFKIPSIIRLLYKTHRRHVPVLRYSRKNVYLRDNNTCQYCGSKKELSIDHVFPLSKGGQSTWENTVTACLKCNRKKGNKTPEEVGLTLMKKPVKPDYIFEIEIDIDWFDMPS